MRTYRWVCHACAQVNDPGSAECNACGCPALATVAEIDRIRSAVPSQLPNPVAMRNAVALRGVSIFLFIAAWSLGSYAAPLVAWLGAFVLAAGALVFWALSEQPDSSVGGTGSARLRRLASTARGLWWPF